MQNTCGGSVFINMLGECLFANNVSFLNCVFSHFSAFPLSLPDHPPCFKERRTRMLFAEPLSDCDSPPGRSRGVCEHNVFPIAGWFRRESREYESSLHCEERGIQAVKPKKHETRFKQQNWVSGVDGNWVFRFRICFALNYPGPNLLELNTIDCMETGSKSQMLGDGVCWVQPV